MADRKISPHDLIVEAQGIWSRADMERQPTEGDYTRTVELYSGVSRKLADKASHQSQVLLPDVQNIVRAIASNIVSAVRNAKPFPELDVMCNDMIHKNITQGLQKILAYHLEKAGFEDILKSAVGYAIMAGYCPAKVTWGITRRQVLMPDGSLENVEEGGLKLRLIDPVNFWLDPRGLNRYVIERNVVTIDYLKAHADELGFDKAAVNKITPNESAIWPDVDEYTTALMSGVDGQNNDQTGLVELMEFCGEIYTKDGELIVRNGRFVIANRKHLLLKPQEYDYLHGETPYVIMNPENIVQYGYPQSFIWNYLDLIESNSDLYNLTVDTARMALPLITYYSGGIALDPEEFLDGIYPGMTIPLNNPGSDHINIQTAPVNPGAVLAILQYSQQQLQQINSGLVQAGLPSGRGRQSATEVNAAQALANSFIVDIMDSISKTFLSPLIERSLFLIAQYQDDFADEKWKWILGDTHEPFIEAISSMDITDTLGLLRIRVEEPADILRKRMTAETLISSFKTMMQAVPGYLNVPVHLYDIYKLLGLDPQRYINTEINYSNLAMAGFLNGLLPQLQQGGQPLPQGNEGLTAYNQPGATFPGGMPQGMPMQGGMPQGMPPQGMPPQRGGY